MKDCLLPEGHEQELSEKIARLQKQVAYLVDMLATFTAHYPACPCSDGDGYACYCMGPPEKEVCARCWREAAVRAVEGAAKEE